VTRKVQATIRATPTNAVRTPTHSHPQGQYFGEVVQVCAVNVIYKQRYQNSTTTSEDKTNGKLIRPLQHNNRNKQHSLADNTVHNSTR